MPPILATAEVDRPAEDVFAYATDPARFPEWQAGVVSGHMDGGETGVGARCISVRRIGGAERASTSQLVHVDTPRTWSVRGIDGPIPAAVDVTVEPIGANRSRVSVGSTSPATASGSCSCRSSSAARRARRCRPSSPGSRIASSSTPADSAASR